MSDIFTPAKLIYCGVEDNARDKSDIEQKLVGTDIFDLEVYDDYGQGFTFRRARAADIVSLDTEVRRGQHYSIEVAQELKIINPEQSVIFFTSNPNAVMTEPINFVLGKSSQVWESYERLLMMILIHDRSLSLLKTIDELHADSEPSRIGETLYEIDQQLRRFIPPLLSVQQFFGEKDRKAARRYKKLLQLLEKIYRGGANMSEMGRDIYKQRLPLMNVVIDEQSQITQVEGVYATPKLKNEIQRLKRSIKTKQEYIAPGLKERAKVYTMEKAARSLEIVKDLLLRLNPGGVRFVTPVKYKKKIGRSSVKKGSAIIESLGERGVAIGRDVNGTIVTGSDLEKIEEQAPSSETEIEKTNVEEIIEGDEREPLYLNAWFPDYEEEETLTVGIPARLLINLAAGMKERPLGASQPIPADKTELFYATKYVDVMVVCPQADVDPVFDRLEMPPRQDRFVEFKITPKYKGTLDLTIVLLIRNEPIHRALFSCDAVEAEAQMEVAEVARSFEVAGQLQPAEAGQPAQSVEVAESALSTEKEVAQE